MKINTINQFSKVSFKSWNNNQNSFYNDEETFGETDYQDSSLRDAIRAHLYEYFLPTEEPPKRQVSDATKIEDVFVPNLKKISNDSYLGSTLAKSPEVVALLPNSNITTMIDLVGFKTLQEACNKNNIKYIKYPITFEFFENPIFKTDDELLNEYKESLYTMGLCKKDFDYHIELNKKCISKERELFITNFAKLIDEINHGHFYISCELGEDRTPNIIALNSYFNPNWQDKTEPIYPSYVKKFKTMYLNLTEYQKQQLQINNEYDEYLRTKFNISEQN